MTDEQWGEPSKDQLEVQKMLETLGEQVVRALGERRLIAECRMSRRGYGIGETPLKSALKAMLELEEHATRIQRTTQ